MEERDFTFHLPPLKLCLSKPSISDLVPKNEMFLPPLQVCTLHPLLPFQSLAKQRSPLQLKAEGAHLQPHYLSSPSPLNLHYFS